MKRQVFCGDCESEIWILRTF